MKKAPVKNFCPLTKAQTITNNQIKYVTLKNIFITDLADQS